jgi:DNA-binding transcriptional MocR family regulator
MAEPIALIRATPPLLESVEGELQRTLRELAAEREPAHAVQGHRFAGTAADRAAGAAWLGRRLGAAPDPDRVIVTSATQNTLFILLASLVGSGGTLLAEALTYPQLTSLATLLGVRVQPVAIDADGILPDAFEEACRAHRPKALYLIAAVQNPTASILPLERRHALAAIARRYGVLVLEDDAQAMLPPAVPPPLAAIAPDVTWYVMSLSKCVAVGLRVGYVVAPSAAGVEAVMRVFRRMSMWFATPLSALIATRWIADGTAARMLDAIRADMGRRHAIAAAALHGCDYAAQPNTLHLWLRAPSADALVAAARDAGVIVRGGPEFAVVPGAAADGARVSLAAVSHAALAAGLTALGRVAGGA